LKEFSRKNGTFYSSHQPVQAWRNHVFSLWFLNISPKLSEKKAEILTNGTTQVPLHMQKIS
jgi:hypothetical protein